MADRRGSQDDDVHKQRRGGGRTTSSSSQSAAKSQQSAVVSPQTHAVAHPHSNPRPDLTAGSVMAQASLNTSPRQSQKIPGNRPQLVGGQASSGSTPYVSSGDIRAMSASPQEERSGYSRTSSAYPQLEQPLYHSHPRRDSSSTSRSGITTSSRSNSVSTTRSDSTMTSLGESSMGSTELSRESSLKRQTQIQARAELKRLLDEGYEQDEAIQLIKERMTRLSLNQAKKDDSDDDESDEGDENDEDDEDEVGDEGEEQTAVENDKYAAIRARLPGPFKGPLAWTGQNLETGCEIIKLGSGEIESIRSAVATFRRTKAPLGDITKKMFRLSPRLEDKLRDVSQEIHRGRGFVTLRGLQKAAFDDYESTLAFVGLAAHVCPERAISMFPGFPLAMEHIYDGQNLPAEAGQPELPPTKLPNLLRFHADRFNGDVLAMHVRHPGSANEGHQYVASFTTIYNELLDKSPETLLILGRADWPFAKKASKDSPTEIVREPVIFFNGARVPICQLVLEPLLGEPRVPRSLDEPMSPEQLQAITRVQKLAAQHQYKLGRQKGDVQFINNLGYLHARGEYNTNGSSGRYLLRMFLRDPQYAWPKGPWKAYFDKPFENSSVKGLIDHRDQYPRIAVFLHG